MKRFLINLLIFFTFLMIPIAIIVVGNIIILNSSTFWKLPNNEEYIVLGNSHSECAFNDSFIPNLVNLSLGGEAYLYTYTKLKKLIESNIQLKTIFIEFENNNIRESMNFWTWDDEHITDNLPKYFPIIDQTEMKVLCKNNLKSVLSVPPKNYIKKIGYNYYNLLFKENSVITKKRRFGGYLHLIRNKTDSLINARESENEVNNNGDLKISEINIHYLHKILELCEQNEIETYLIRSPVHEMYSDPQTEKLFKYILKNRFSDVVFLDFGKFPLKNNEFGDFGHLNYKGAEIFSKWFAQLLHKNLLEKENKQAFIDEEIKARMHNNEDTKQAK